MGAINSKYSAMSTHHHLANKLLGLWVEVLHSRVLRLDLARVDQLERRESCPRECEDEGPVRVVEATMAVLTGSPFIRQGHHCCPLNLASSTFKTPLSGNQIT